MTATETAYDPYAAAMTATEQPRTTFGEITNVDVWPCVLVKGVGKQVYDPGQHSPSQRRTAITIAISPLRGNFEIKRETLDIGKDWLQITLPSLRALGADLRALKGKYCQVEQKPTGETYTSKDGATKERTGLSFLAIFDTREQAEAAAEALYGPRSTSPVQGAAPRNAPQPLPSDDTSDAERATALAALPHLWIAAGRDARKLDAMIAANPLIAKYAPAGSDPLLALDGYAF